MAKSNPIHPFFYLLLTLVVLASFYVIRPFIAAIVLAFIGAVIFKPVFELFTRITKGRIASASILTVVVVATTIIIPLILIVNTVIGQIAIFATDINGVLQDDAVTLESTITTINELLADIPYNQTQISVEQVTQTIQQLIRSTTTTIIGNAARIGSSSVEIISLIIIFLVMLNVFVAKQDMIIELIKRMSPLEDDVDTLYISRVLTMMTSMIKGSFLVAIIQGVAAGILLWATGVPYSFFFTVIMIFLGVVPLFGTGGVSIPIGIIQLLTGQIWQGIVVIAGSIFIISNIDNVLRPYFVSKDASLSPSMIILGMFGGLKVFGFMGFLYGPVVLILLTTTIQVYLEHKR